MLTGNPLGDDLSQLDPGLKSPVVSLGWKPSGSLTNGYILPEFSCYQNSQVVTTSDSSDYTAEMESQVDVEAAVSGEYGGFKGEASFSASRGAQEFKQSIALTTDTRYSVTSFCMVTQAGFNSVRPQPCMVALHLYSTQPARQCSTFTTTYLLLLVDYLECFS